MKKDFFNNLKKKSINIFIKHFYIILLPIIISVSYVLSHYLTIDHDIFIVIVTASSFIVAVSSGFLINSYYNVKQIRWEKLGRFAELQNRLKEYAEAFYWFVHDLTRTHTLNYRFPESIETLERDGEWNFSNDESVAVRFVRYLREFAGLPSDIPDFELTNSIIKKERLEQMHKYVLSAGGLLTRYKHFKYIIKVFHLLDTQDLDAIVITESEFVKHAAKKIMKPNEDFTTLGFWDAKISECEEILSRMMANGKFVYSFNVYSIRRIGLNLLYVSVFGIILPITILMTNNITLAYRPFLSIVSAIGFITYFSIGIVGIFKKLSSSQLSYS